MLSYAVVARVLVVVGVVVVFVAVETAVGADGSGGGISGESCDSHR